MPRVADDALRVDFELPATAEGREAAEAVRSGKRSRMSIEFHSLAETVTSGVREIVSALIDAVALVPAGQYQQARAEVREADREDDAWRLLL